MFNSTISKSSLLLLAGLLFIGCSHKKPSKQSVPKSNIPVDEVLTHRLDSLVQHFRPIDKTAIYVYDLTADRSIYGFHENSLMPTASCLKLLTGIAAQHLLGQSYRFRTKLFTKGHLEGSTFQGDVIFKAGLDPQFNPPDLKLFTQQLWKRGIRKITGKVLIDLVITEPAKAEPHWYPWDLNFSKFGLFYKGTPRIMKEIKYSLRARGISFTDSNVCLGRRPARASCLYSYGRPIRLVLTRMWKNSSNTQSTSLLYAIGHHVQPHGEPLKAGVAYLRKFMREEVGIPDSAYTIHDGCGLCPYDKLTPKQLALILRYGYQHPSIFNWSRKLLPLAGVNGTLRREMPGKVTKGKIMAKTGTLSHPFGISSLSGYCVGKNGHQLCFSVLNSEMSVLDARVLQRKLCELCLK